MSSNIEVTKIARPELDLIKDQGYEFDQTWQVVDIFEKKLAEFFGAPYAVVTDCSTHAMELCFLLLNQRDQIVEVPVSTYMSVPMMLTKIQQSWQFVDNKWTDWYSFDPLPIIDAAFMWRRNSYQPGTLTCVSFQQKKHIAIGRGGVIFTDQEAYYNRLQMLCRDGRDRKLLQADDDIKEIGYHYYMTPEDAARGILLFDQLHDVPSRVWGWQDYKVLTENTVFSHHLVKTNL
jgi:dTDP-4-amino-4,6-dideoxygalactose transaminase